MTGSGHTTGRTLCQGRKGPRKRKVSFHGRFLRSEDFSLQNSATLRNALRTLNCRPPSIRDGMQSSETMCNSLGLNP
jgi:hypothetical protein